MVTYRYRRRCNTYTSIRGPSNSQQYRIIILYALVAPFIDNTWYTVYAETNRYRFAAIIRTSVLSSAVGHIIFRPLIIWILQSSSSVSKSQTREHTNRGRADAAGRSDAVRIRSGFPCRYYLPIYYIYDNSAENRFRTIGKRYHWNT